MSLTPRQPDLALPDRIKNALPFEMQQLKQWILWELIPNEDPTKKADKVPLSLHTLNRIDPTQEKFCGTFDQVAGSYLSHIAIRPNIGIGFTLQPHSAPLVAFDLDNYTDAQAYEFFTKEGLPPTYLERSPSGKGFRALYLYPEAGNHASRRNDAEGFEVYTNKRFLTITGNVVANPGVTLVNGEMGKFFERHKASQALGLSANLAELNKPETKTDEEVIAVASRSKHGEEFQRLYNNTVDRSRYNDDQSAIDQAFVNMLQFYSGNVNQIVRIWLGSALASQRGGKDGPAKLQRRDYILRTVGNAFDRTVPTQPGVIGLQAQLKKYGEVLRAKEADRLTANPVMSVEEEPDAPDSSDDNAYEIPPGFVGAVHEVLCGRSLQSTDQFGIVAGLAILAGCVGRTHFVQNHTLALAQVLMAPSGSGKEAIASTRDFLFNRAMQENPHMGELMQFVGDGELVSKKGAMRMLKERPSCLSIIPEGTMELVKMLKAPENSPKYGVQQVLLDLYGKGPNQIIKGSTNAKKEDSTDDIISPALSVIYEGVAHRLYDDMDAEMISSGFFPRHVFVEYTGKIPQPNFEAFKYECKQSTLDIIFQLFTDALNARYAMSVLRASAVRSVSNFPIEVKLAGDVLEQWKQDTIDNNEFRDANKENCLSSLYNRHIVNALKVASLVAIGINFHAPVVNMKMYEWAKDYVGRGLDRIAHKYREGALGSGDGRAYEAIRNYCVDWLKMDVKARMKYKSYAKIANLRIVPRGYIANKARRNSIFNKHRFGASTYLDSMLKQMDKDGLIKFYPKGSHNFDYNGEVLELL